MTTIRDLTKTNPLLSDHDYKWTDSDGYIDLNEILEQIGFALIDPSIAGEYNDIKAYYNCEVEPL